MNILFINHNVIGSGTYLRVFHIAKSLVNYGHDMTILTTSKKSKFHIFINKENKITIVQFPDLFSNRLRNGICPWNTLRRIFYLKRKYFDLVHAFDTRPVAIFPALFYKYNYHVPLFIDWADWWGKKGTIQERSGKFYDLTLGRFEVFFEEYFRKFADGATVICSALRRRLADLGYNPSNILLLPQGTDLDKIEQLDKNYCRKLLGIDLNVSLIGHLGTLFKKDAELLFESINNARKNAKDVRLILIGRHKLKLKAFKDIRKFLIETGEIDERKISIYLSACDILVLPLQKNIANNGRWPSKINDYFASGKPIVSTPISDIKTIFEKEKIGILADDNPEDFSRALLNIIRDKILQVQLGEKGKKYAAHNLDWNILAGNLSSFYYKCQQSKKN